MQFGKAKWVLQTGRIKAPVLVTKPDWTLRGVILGKRESKEEDVVLTVKWTNRSPHPPQFSETPLLQGKKKPSNSNPRQWGSPLTQETFMVREYSLVELIDVAAKFQQKSKKVSRYG